MIEVLDLMTMTVLRGISNHCATSAKQHLDVNIYSLIGTTKKVTHSFLEIIALLSSSQYVQNDRREKNKIAENQNGPNYRSTISREHRIQCVQVKTSENA